MITGPIFHATCPNTHKRQDLSLGSFVDDLLKFYMIPDGAARQPLTIDCTDNSVLNDELGEDGHAQNVSKQDTTIKLSSARATKLAEQRISGQAVTQLIHLGGYVSDGGSYTREITERVRSANIGWCMLSRFLTPPTAIRCKRMMLSASVAGRAWSGR
eukprot:8775863-Pyramimonas_sp.AAC.1